MGGLAATMIGQDIVPAKLRCRDLCDGPVKNALNSQSVQFIGCKYRYTEFLVPSTIGLETHRLVSWSAPLLAFILKEEVSIFGEWALPQVRKGSTTCWPNGFILNETHIVY